MGCFSADSRTLYWGRTSPTGIDHIYRRAIDGSTAEELLYVTKISATPRGLTADERHLALDVWDISNQWDIALLPLDVENPEPQPYLGGPSHQLWANFSPDGKWMTYFSDETGSFELYVRRYPDTGARWLGGTSESNTDQTTWGADGRSIFFRDHTATYRIPYSIEGESFVVGKQERISVDDHVLNAGSYVVPIDPAGRYVYVLVSESSSDDEESEQTIVLETNWLDGLKRQFESQQ